MTSPIEDIKARLNVVDVIQGYVRLQKAGINYKANCPFHGEKTPSFFVSPTRQIWHCFGCARGGDIFKFVMEIEGHDFPEALRLLAVRAGVVLTREDPRIRSERNRLYDICEEATKLFQGHLARTPAVLRYLSGRGLLPETISSFRVGFAPRSWDSLGNALRAKGFRSEEIERAGLAVRSEEKNSWYDRFRGRIIFPITDQSGRVIGFGGRLFETGTDPKEKEEAKYVNTPQTPIYDKSRVLYGFDRAKQDIRRLGNAVLVEGYMDCVMSHQAGVVNTVAVSGTALTPSQLTALKRLSDSLLFSFDTDTAGESATKRSLSLAAELDFERKIIEIPSGKDPADTVKESKEAWREAVLAALPVTEFYFRKATARYDPKTPEGKKAIVEMLLPYIVEIRDEIQKAHWVEKLAQTLSVPRDAVQKELARRSGPTVSARPVEAEKGEALLRRRDLLEERFLALLSVVGGSLSTPSNVSPHITFTSSPNGELFAILRSGAPTDVPAHLADHYSMLRFKGEILLQMTKSAEEEFHISERELEKECVKDKLLAIGSEIERLEREGDRSKVSSLLADFRELSTHLKTLSR